MRVANSVHSLVGIRRCFIAAAAWVCIIATASAAPVTELFTYRSSVSADGDGPLDLVAELNYDDARLSAPIVVVMHGYSPATGNLTNVRVNAQRLRDSGFFAVSVAMRGRDGSDGVRDSGGVEIYDIYDAVEAVKAGFPARVDPTNVHITGYSGGGGNVMSALTKFPDYFRLGAAFFGMSDYGYDPVNGWYFKGAGSRIAQLQIDIGDPVNGGPDVTDRYHARVSNLASRNNPYSEIHLFVNYNETICPPVNDTTYHDNAVAAAAYPGEFDNIHVHIGRPGTYEDFDGDGVNDPEEEQSWPHQAPTETQQKAAESWYLARLLSGAIPEPVLNASDDLFVAGFVKARRFELRLGDGQNAAGGLLYSLSETTKRFDLEILSLNKAVTGRLVVDTSDTTGRSVYVSRNGVIAGSFVGGGAYECDGFAHEEELALWSPERICHAVSQDVNDDGDVDLADFSGFQGCFNGPNRLPQAVSDQQACACLDHDSDGDVDLTDFTRFATCFNGPNRPPACE